MIGLLITITFAYSFITNNTKLFVYSKAELMVFDSCKNVFEVFGYQNLTDVCDSSLCGENFDTT